MSYQCDNCNRKVGVVRYDDKKWVCDKCYWKKEKENEKMSKLQRDKEVK